MHCVKKTLVSVFVLMCIINTSSAQFAPAANEFGTTAIAGDSTIFVEWASGCVVERGPMNIDDTSLGLASAGVSLNALGMADGVIVSLGDAGVATLTFNHPIYNGAGFDFAIFENGFYAGGPELAFLELGFVEVSTDGVRYVRFSATSNVEDSVQYGNGSYMDCSKLNNLAGKYVAGYGTPFDLQELVDSPGIDVNNINYVRIIDVVGSIDSAYGTCDHSGHLINDPWPTPFASCGFDLDAVGVIHATGVSGISSIAESGMNVYPNPVRSGDAFKVHLPEDVCSIKMFNTSGQLLHQWATTNGRQTINTDNLSSGVYFLSAENGISHFNTKIIVE